MPVQAWVTIAVFVLGIMWSVAVWLVGRRVSRIDELEKQVNGREGLVRQVDRLITREEFVEGHAELEEILKGISEEGQVREQRMRDHGDQLRRALEQDLRELRREMSEIHKRVDVAMRARR